MHEIINTLEDPRLIAALESNLEEEMMCFGRGLTGAEIYSDGEIEGFFTGRGHLNGLLRTHLRSQESAYVESKIQAALRYFRAKGAREVGWSLGRDSQPAHMERYLEAQGFRKLPEENVGMVLDIATMQAQNCDVKGLEIREVVGLEDLKVLRQLEIEGFGSSAEIAQYYFEMYAGVGFGQGTAWRHFIGWRQDQAVSSTSLLFYAGVAGLYGVTTVPQARRQGIARAMVLRAIEQARQTGYQIAVLSPTEMSEGIYRRLGFRACTCIHHFTREL